MSEIEKMQKEALEILDENETTQEITIEINDGNPWFVRIGIGVTLVYLCLLISFPFWTSSNLSDMTPNAWGDFLAGAFGPLALLWVVLGFFQQGSELRNSRNALLLQHQELKQSVDAQKDLVTVAREQISVDRENFKSERAADREKVQPRLRLQGRGNGPGNQDGRRHRFAVVNVGTNCSDVTISAHNHNIDGPVGGFPLLKQGADIFFDMNFRIDDDPHETLIHANYVDAMGSRGERFFIINYASNATQIMDTVGTSENPGNIMEAIDQA